MQDIINTVEKYDNDSVLTCKNQPLNCEHIEKKNTPTTFNEEYALNLYNDCHVESLILSSKHFLNNVLNEFNILPFSLNGKIFMKIHIIKI